MAEFATSLLSVRCLVAHSAPSTRPNAPGVFLTQASAANVLLEAAQAADA
jgi:hypothetical protein